MLCATKNMFKYLRDHPTKTLNTQSLALLIDMSHDTLLGKLGLKNKKDGHLLNYIQMLPLIKEVTHV